MSKNTAYIEKDWIIEVDITHQCNLKCRHCNRLCNQVSKFFANRKHLHMQTCHIDHLCAQIKKYPKGKVRMIRILGGEPLLSPILKFAIEKFEQLKGDGYIKEICVMSNGTVDISENIMPYVIFFPPRLRQMAAEKVKLTENDVYEAKNERHVNITISPLDFNETVSTICDRYIGCGIHYTVYGFSLTAPCFPTLFVFPRNHKYFRRDLPPSVDYFIDNAFEKEVCSFCVYGFKTKEDLSDIISNSDYIGVNWSRQIQQNKNQKFIEPDVKWIDEV